MAEFKAITSALCSRSGLLAVELAPPPRAGSPSRRSSRSGSARYVAHIASTTSIRPGPRGRARHGPHGRAADATAALRRRRWRPRPRRRTTRCASADWERALRHGRAGGRGSADRRGRRRGRRSRRARWRPLRRALRTPLPRATLRAPADHAPTSRRAARACTVAAIRVRCAVVDGGTDERMPEPHRLTDLDEAKLLRLGGRGIRQTERSCCAAHDGGIARGLGRREHDPHPRRRRERRDAGGVVLLEAMPERHRGVADQGRRQLLGGQLRAEVAERERIAAGVRDDVRDDRGVDVSVDRRHGERAAADSGSRPARRQARHARQRTDDAVVIARGEDERDRLGRQPASDESEHFERLAVEMVGVVDDADRRNVVARAGEDRQHPEPDERALGRSARGQAGRDQEPRLAGRAGCHRCSERAGARAAARLRTRAPPRPRTPRPAAPGRR